MFSSECLPLCFRRFVLVLAALWVCPAAFGASPSRYDVVWDTPSVDSSESMPTGNGRVGLNVWAEPGGVIKAYVGRTDSWAESSRLLKVGGFELRFPDRDFTGDAGFSQRLDLAESRVVTTLGEGKDRVTAVIWVDANRDLIHLEVESAQPVLSQLRPIVWRTEDRTIGKSEAHSRLNVHFGFESADVVRALTSTGELVVYHRNQRSAWEQNMRRQHFTDLIPSMQDPLLHRTTGLLMRGRSVELDAAEQSLSARGDQAYFQIVATTLHPATEAQWIQHARGELVEMSQAAVDDARSAHQAWWADFWDRSWVHVSVPDAPERPTHRGVIPSGQPLAVGAKPGGASRHPGVYDEVRVYRGVLTPEQVAAHAADPAVVTVGTELVGRWTFDEGTHNGEAYTDPDSGLRLVERAGTAQLLEGVRGQAARLGSSYLQMDRELATDEPFTWELWFKPDKNLNSRHLMSTAAGRNEGASIDTWPRGGLRLVSAAGYARRDIKPVAGQWNHIVVSYDHEVREQAVYLNGEEIQRVNRFVKYPPVLDADHVGRAHTLQRYVTAAGGRGPYPIKFNGSIFTWDHTAEAANGEDWTSPDYRRWGPAYWFQNTRHMYWPLLASGDYEMMHPFFEMFRNTLPVAEARTRLIYGIDGGFFPETMLFWGTYTDGDYGRRPDKKARNAWINDYHSGNLELLVMGIDLYRHTGDEKFLRETLLPLSKAILTFYFEHTDRDENGKVFFKDSQALETFQKADNPANEIAGLQDTIARLLALPEGTLGAEFRDQLKGWQPLIPELPIRGEGDERRLAAAGTIHEKARNSENPELYAVFPFRLFGVGIDHVDLDMARRTFAGRRNRGAFSWQQNDIQAAYLGLREQFESLMFSRVRRVKYRFPVFYGPNNDWTPDQCHGGAMQNALQVALLHEAPDGSGDLLLFPAWPLEWNVDFKLHAPGGITVQAVYQGGELKTLKVTPESAADRVRVMLPGHDSPHEGPSR